MVSSRLPPAPMRTAAEVVAVKGEEEEEELGQLRLLPLYMF